MTCSIAREHENRRAVPLCVCSHCEGCCDCDDAPREPMKYEERTLFVITVTRTADGRVIGIVDNRCDVGVDLHVSVARTSQDCHAAVSVYFPVALPVSVDDAGDLIAPRAGERC